MTIEQIRDAVIKQISRYPICKVTLFGSRAAGTNRSDSDVDLIMEFSEPVTLLTLNSIRYALEDALMLSVDVIHGPITTNDMIQVDKEVVLYAA